MSRDKTSRVGGPIYASDHRSLEMLGERLFGKPVEAEAGSDWQVVVNPPELDLSCGTVLVRGGQYFAVDKQSGLFREIYTALIEGSDRREVVGISGRTHIGNEDEPVTDPNARIVCGHLRYGGIVFWG